MPEKKPLHKPKLVVFFQVWYADTSETFTSAHFSETRLRYSLWDRICL